MDLFDNPVGYRTSLAKCSAFYCFLSEFVQKLQFLNNSNEAAAKFVYDPVKAEQLLAITGYTIFTPFQQYIPDYANN
jgi:hypothetical protein